MLIFKFLDCNVLVACDAFIPFKSGTTTDVEVVLPSPYKIIKEFLGKELPGFGFWSSTKIVFASPFTYVFTLNPASFRVFSASATV